MSNAKGNVSNRTAARIADVKQFTADGLTVGQMAERMGVTKRTVTRLRARAGLTDGVRKAPFTPAQLELFDRLLTEGWSYREIQNTYGANEGHIARHFPGRGWTPAQKVEIREARRTLATIPTITGRQHEPAERFNGHRRTSGSSLSRRWAKTGSRSADQMAG